MKKLFLIAFFVIVILQNLKADQLAWITKQQASETLSLLQQKKEILINCGCCDNDEPIYIELQKSYMKYTGSDDYYQVFVEGIKQDDGEYYSASVDLAYLFIDVDGAATCVGIALGYDCDPCVGPFDWQGVGSDAPYNDFAEDVSTLIYSSADAMGQQGYLLTFVEKDDKTAEHLFPMTLDQLNQLDIQLVDWDSDAYGVASSEWKGKTFKVFSYVTEIENEFTGDIEVQSIITSVEPVGIDKAAIDVEQLSELLLFPDKLSVLYEQSDLGFLEETLPLSHTEGILPIIDFFPDFESLSELGRVNIGTDDCAGFPIFRTAYRNGLIADDGIVSGYYYSTNKALDAINLSLGNTKVEVINKLGMPYKTEGDIMIYLVEDEVAEMHSYETGMKNYYAGIRMFFKNGGLFAVWVQLISDC